MAARVRPLNQLCACALHDFDDERVCSLQQYLTEPDIRIS
jgi:hypothetical protein